MPTSIRGSKKGRGAQVYHDATNTLHLSDLDDRVDKELLQELCIQAGPVVRIGMPPGEGGRNHKGYAFCEYPSPATAEYARALFTNCVVLYGRKLKVNFSPLGCKEPTLCRKDALQ